MSPPKPNPVKVIFDTDPGVDDAMALALIECSPTLELIGITTTTGNADIDTTTRNALYLAEQFDLAAPVFKGAATPLVVEPGDPPTFVHGDDALGNTSPAVEAREHSALSAVEFIVDAAHRYPGEVVLIAVGRLTNLALALQTDPSIAERYAQVVIMGGAFGTHGHSGNVTPHAEANIYGDPHAADDVVAAPWPVTLVPLDVTMQVMMTNERMQRIRTGADEIGELIWQVSRFYQSFYRARHNIDGFPVHDSSAVTQVLLPDAFEVRRGALRVDVDGEVRGRTRWVDDASRPAQQVCIGVDADAVLSCYERALCDLPN